MAREFIITTNVNLSYICWCLNPVTLQLSPWEDSVLGVRSVCFIHNHRYAWSTYPHVKVWEVCWDLSSSLDVSLVHLQWNIIKLITGWINIFSSGDFMLTCFYKALTWSRNMFFETIQIVHCSSPVL